MSPERRRFKRIDCSLAVELKAQGRVMDLVTANVSRHGVFIPSDTPRNPRELLQLRFKLGDFGIVDVMCMVARVVRRDPNRPGQVPGMGVDFFALSSADKGRWNDFLRALERLDQRGEIPTLPPDHPGEEPQPEAPPQREDERYINTFFVNLKDKRRLRRLFTRDICQGSMFLKTTEPHKVMPEVELVIVHPQSKDEFIVGGTVVRSAQEGAPEDWGIAIRFDELEAERERALIAFIETGVNYLDRDMGPEDERYENLELAIKLTAGWPESLADLGESLLRDRELNMAQRCFALARVKDPRHMRACLGLYRACKKLGFDEDAAEHLQFIRNLRKDRKEERRLKHQAGRSSSRAEAGPARASKPPAGQGHPLAAAELADLPGVPDPPRQARDGSPPRKKKKRKAARKGNGNARAGGAAGTAHPGADPQPDRVPVAIAVEAYRPDAMRDPAKLSE